MWFDSKAKELPSIYQRESSGESSLIPRLNLRTPVVKEFSLLGLFSFGTTNTRSSLTIVVLPEIRFHWKLIRLSDFDAQAIRTDVNDFIIWQFEQVIRYNMIQLRSNETLQDLVACHDRASYSRNRQCIAVECIMPGIFYFANPGQKSQHKERQTMISSPLEFERVTGSEQVEQTAMDGGGEERVCFSLQRIV